MAAAQVLNGPDTENIAWINFSSSASAIIGSKRIAEADDIVGPIQFLLGPASRYMTGQTLWVNGGAYMP